MYKLSKSFTFEMAHKLTDYSGKCQRLHGHSGKLTIVFIGKDLFNNNILVDYCDIKSLVQPMIDQFLDHQYLNETLDTKNPTSEFIAKWVFEYIEFLLATNANEAFSQVKLYEVEVNETCTSSCSYKKYEQYY